MAQLVRDVMTRNPVTLSPDTPVRQAAQAMREKDIGNVLVRDGDRLAGIVTDRDLVVRAPAEKDDPRSCTLGEVCSGELVTARPEEPADAAIQRMRQHAVRPDRGSRPRPARGRPVGRGRRDRARPVVGARRHQRGARQRPARVGGPDRGNRPP